MNENLFEKNLEEHFPLARRMRPRSFEEFIGQKQVLGKGKPLERLISSGHLASLILFGPPGTGKTALSHLIAESYSAEFSAMNAVTSGVSDIRKISEEAKERLMLHGKKTLLFIDEIHRFNKAQQDALLPDIENGRLILIGATTHNPSAYVTSALASRTHFFEFLPLNEEELFAVACIALKDSDRGLGRLKLEIEETALKFLANISDGDARRLLNMLELIAASAPLGSKISRDEAAKSIGTKVILHDKDEDAHYDCASAFIKSLRGSDPDAAIYYMARMIEGGDDPRFIARRMMIFASEDIGNADVKALLVATSASQALELVGMPEARIILAQAATYLASAPKSNASYEAIDSALNDVRNGKLLDVPNHLRGTGYRDAEKFGRGEGYKYPHSHGGFVKQKYLAEDRSYYLPKEIGDEKRLFERLKALWGEWPRKEEKS